MSEQAKSIIFYGVFFAMIAIYIAIFGTHFFGRSDLSGSVMALIVSSAPVVMQDLSVAGEITPPILAGLMAATIPQRSSLLRTLISFSLAVVCYLLYLQLTTFLGGQEAKTILLSADLSPEKDTGVLTGFAGGVRTFAAILAAAVIGLKFNRSSEKGE